jgi:hypothetical protein
MHSRDSIDIPTIYRDGRNVTWTNLKAPYWTKSIKCGTKELRLQQARRQAYAIVQQLLQDDKESG